MNTRSSSFATLLALSAATPAAGQGVAQDPRIRTVTYAPDTVIPVAVRRGMVTHIVLPEDETLSTPPATGKGADCTRETDTWCIAAVGRDIFLKPKTGATRNNMVLVSSRRRHAFDLLVQPDTTPASAAVMRLVVKLPPPPAQVASAPVGPPPMTAQELVDNRMRNEPTPRNTQYAVAVGEHSEDIVPTLVFDDGTHTYMAFPNNRPLPTVFAIAPDQSEQMVNAGMQGDLLVADHVGRRFVLRLGNSVVAVINEAFDIDGVPPKDGTTVPGVQRVVRSDAPAPQDAQR